MATKREFAVFPCLNGTFVPAGLLTLTEVGAQLKASEFAYGTRYIDRPGAVEADPISLSLKDKESLCGKGAFPANWLPFFGGILDAAPDA